jgi:hypothetical protein
MILTLVNELTSAESPFSVRFLTCDSNDMLADEETIIWPQVADSCGSVWPESRV